MSERCSYVIYCSAKPSVDYAVPVGYFAGWSEREGAMFKLVKEASAAEEFASEIEARMAVFTLRAVERRYQYGIMMMDEDGLVAV